METKIPINVASTTNLSVRQAKLAYYLSKWVLSICYLYFFPFNISSFISFLFSSSLFLACSSMHRQALYLYKYMFYLKININQSKIYTYLKCIIPLTFEYPHSSYICENNNTERILRINFH